MKNQFYLFATFARSFDKSHVGMEKIHLVSSAFYSDYFKIDPLITYKNTIVQYVIRVSDNLNSNQYKDIDVNFIKHSDYLIEIVIPLYYFIESSSNIKPS